MPRQQGFVDLQRHLIPFGNGSKRPLESLLVRFEIEKDRSGRTLRPSFFYEERGRKVMLTEIEVYPNDPVRRSSAKERSHWEGTKKPFLGKGRA